MIPRDEPSEIRNQKVLLTIAIHVEHLNMRGIGDAGDRGKTPLWIGEVADQDNPVPHLGCEQVEPSVAVDVDELHMRYRRRGRSVGRREISYVEAGSIGRRPRRWRRQPIG